MNHIYAYINDLLEKNGDTRHVQLVQAWPDVMGRLSEYTRLESFQDGSVVIGAYDPQWLQELHFFAPTIKQQINAHFHADVVQQVRIKLVARRKKRNSKVHTPVDQSSHATRKQMPKRHAQVLEAIHDTHLRQALCRLYYNRESSY